MHWIKHFNTSSDNLASNAPPEINRPESSAQVK